MALASQAMAAVGKAAGEKAEAGALRFWPASFQAVTLFGGLVTCIIPLQIDNPAVVAQSVAATQQSYCMLLC